MNIVNTVDTLLPCKGSGVTIGNFDGVHKGHQELIRRTLDVCAQDALSCVLMTFTPHPREVLHPERGHSPLTTRDERMALLADLHVPNVLEIPFTHDLAALTPEEFIQRYLLPLEVRRLVVGHDFTLGRARAGTGQVLAELGAQHGFTVEQLAPVIVDDVIVSSTFLRELIAAGETARAARMLGRCHGFSGVVVHGDGRGESLGFPTANLRPSGVLLPAEGVYASRVLLDGKVRQAVTNVGRRPTFGGNSGVSIESYLLDITGNLYGQHISLEFSARLRGEERFASVEALKDQIARDVAAARRILAQGGGCS